MNQEIEVRPGVVIKSEDGKAGCRPILSKIVSLYAEHNDLQYAVPGGLIGLLFSSRTKDLLSISSRIVSYHRFMEFLIER